MKIIYSWAAHGQVAPYIERDIQQWKNAGFDITSINHREYLGTDSAWSPTELQRRYQARYPKLMDLYARVKSLASIHDVLVVNDDNVYHTEFIRSLNNVYRVLVSGDDPEDSESCSKPYVSSFDHSFAWGINYDSKSLVTEKFREWGSKRADWWPYGVRADMYEPSLTEEDIATKERDIDLIFIGSPRLKLSRVAALKNAFPQMVIFGRGWSRRALFNEVRSHRAIYGKWSWGAAFASVRAVFLDLDKVQQLPMSEIVGLYQRAKIGINIHMSHGPSNVRTFQLPANGVMQVCDTQDGLSKVFELDKEVIGYDKISEAKRKIQYYLSHDDQRKQIAIAGHRRTMSEYTRLETFKRAMRNISLGIQQKKLE